jgi:phytoene dehydrogenase-like protein
MSSTFVVVVILPDGYTAEPDEIRDAIQDQLNRYAPGARVAARGVEDEGDWSTAILDCNMELDNLG